MVKIYPLTRGGRSAEGKVMQFILIVVGIALVGWLAWRGARREISRVNNELRQTKTDKKPANNSTTLKQNPKTGVFRAEGDDE